MAARASVRPKKGMPKTADRPAEEQVRIRAYEIYLERAGSYGSDVDDWLQAEAEVKAAQPAAERSK